jgi:hypothetical protein
MLGLSISSMLCADTRHRLVTSAMAIDGHMKALKLLVML